MAVVGHCRRWSFARTAIPSVVYNGKGTSGEREARRTHLSDPRRHGEDGGSVRLGEAMANGGARLRRGDYEQGWDGAVSGWVDAGGTTLLFKGSGSLESTALTRRLEGGDGHSGDGV